MTIVRSFILISMFVQLHYCSVVQTMQFRSTAYKAAGFAAAALVAYKVHGAIRTPQEFLPTVSNLNTILMTPNKNAAQSSAVKRVSEIIADIENGRPYDGNLLLINNKEKNIWQLKQDLQAQSDAPDIFMYVRGNSDRFIKCIDDMIGSTGTPCNGGGVLETYNNIKAEIINGDSVAFDIPDKHGTLSFGQENEKECLKTAYAAMVAANPNKKVTLIGFCRGAKLGLDFATEYPENLDMMILESPLISFSSATERMSESYLKSVPGTHSLLYNLFRYIFPSYIPSNDTLLEKIDRIPKDMPILIGHLKGDQVVSDQILGQVLQKLKDHNHLYLSVVEDKRGELYHGKLSMTLPYRQVCNAFLAKYGKTHNARLAKEGHDLLANARLNAGLEPEKWLMAEHK